MNIAVTGSRGFIGGHLIPALSQAGHQVQGLDQAVRPGELTHRDVTGDILDPDKVLQALAGAETVIHLAAEHKDYGLTREDYYRTNQQGTRTMLECAGEAGISQFIFYSSVAVYGAAQGADEDQVPQPENHYGASKLAAEAEVAAWAAENPSRRALIIRPTVVFGPENYANMYRLIDAICNGTFYWIGRGENIKSVAFVHNLVAATLFLLDRDQPGLQIYNYSDQPQMPMNQLVPIIAGLAGVKMPRLRVPYRLALAAGGLVQGLGRLTGRQYPLSLARVRKFHESTEYPAEKIRALGFVQPFTIEMGLEQTLAWRKTARRPV